MCGKTNTRRITIWRCRCDCGGEARAVLTNLRNGNTQSCGCRQVEARTRIAQDITGVRSGRLVAIKPTDQRHRGSVLWVCRCDCGGSRLATMYLIKSGTLASCGCATGRGSVLRSPELRSRKATIQNNRHARQKMASGSFTEAQVMERYKSQDGRCLYCNNPLGTDFHRDHDIPLSRGGSNDIGNIYLTCPNCNLIKNAKTGGEFLVSIVLAVERAIMRDRERPGHTD